MREIAEKIQEMCARKWWPSEAAAEAAREEIIELAAKLAALVLAEVKDA